MHITEEWWKKMSNKETGEIGVGAQLTVPGETLASLSAERDHWRGVAARYEERLTAALSEKRTPFIPNLRCDGCDNGLSILQPRGAAVTDSAIDKIERLNTEINRIENSFGRGPFYDGILRERLMSLWQQRHDLCEARNAESQAIR